MQFAPGVVHVAVNDRRYGRAAADGAGPPPRAGQDRRPGRGRAADDRPCRRVRAGSGGTGNPSPTGAAGRAHVAVDDRRYGLAAAGGAGRPMTAPTGGLQRTGQDRRCGRGRAADDRPYRRVHVSPFSMFSNGNLKTPQFSILNSQFSIRPRAWCMWRSMTAAAGGLQRAGLMPAQKSPGRVGQGFFCAAMRLRRAFPRCRPRRPRRTRTPAARRTWSRAWSPPAALSR